MPTTQKVSGVDRRGDSKTTVICRPLHARSQKMRRSRRHCTGRSVDARREADCMRTASLSMPMANERDRQSTAAFSAP